MIATELRWFADAIRAELFKVVRRRMTYICIAAVVVLTGLIYFGLWLRLREWPGETLEERLFYLAAKLAVSFGQVVPYGLSTSRFFATLAGVAFAGTMMGNEYDWRTVGLVTGRGVRRWHYLAAKVVVCGGFTYVLLLAGLGAAAVGSAILTSGYDLSWGSADGERLWDLVAGVTRTGFVVLPFVFVALLFGLLLRSGGQAVGAALGLVFSEQIFIGLLSLASGWPADIPNALFSVNIDAIIRLNGVFTATEGPFFPTGTGPPVWRAVLVLVAWMAGVLALLFGRFARRDIQE